MNLHMIAWILVIIGGLNWLLVGFNWNLVEALLGSWPMIVKIVYILVGLSAAYLVYTATKLARDDA